MSAGSGGVNKRKSYKIDLSAAYLKCGSISPCWWQLSQINTSLSDQVSGPRVATRCTDICRVAFSRPERHHGRAPGSAGDRSLFLIDIIEIFSFPSSFCSVSYIARYFAFSSYGLLILHFGGFGVLHILWYTLYLVYTFLSEYIYSNCYQGALCCRCLVLCLFNLTRIVLDLLYFGVGQWWGPSYQLQK